MSDDEINSAIAEACGWQAEHYAHKCDGTTIFRCGACGGFGHSNCYGDGRGAVSFSCSVSPCCDEAVPPDYCGDLNEMHQAECSLDTGTIKQVILATNHYTDELCRVLRCTGEDLFELTHASSRQRAEAFLRTIGKWKEEAK